MAVDIFSQDFDESARERAGRILEQKDLQEERHGRKKTDEDVFNDFIHNVEHPFMLTLMREAARYERTGLAFVLRSRIAVLIDDKESDEYALYHNDGDTWRQSGEALVLKYLKERFPELKTPGMKFGCKGEKQMLDAYPGRFGWVRQIYKERALKGENK